MDSSGVEPLPVAGASLLDAAATAERCDAARNRRRLLDTAARLVAECGADKLSMERLAEAAGVGKGTIFRRFGNRAGLMAALLDHSEREFQHDFMYGPPPLGPGARPHERLIAFGRVSLQRLVTHGELIRAATPSRGAGFGLPARSVHRTHLAMLLAEGRPVPGHTGADPSMLAECLLEILDAAFVLHLRQDLGYSDDQILQTWTTLVDALTSVPATAPDADTPGDGARLAR